MSRFLILLLVMAGMAVTQAQDNASEATAEDDVSAESETESDDDEALDDSDLDAQIYEEDEDDFVPTEEIPADEPIPFPSNI